jgi:hypothetical protein
MDRGCAAMARMVGGNAAGCVAGNILRRQKFLGAFR